MYFVRKSFSNYNSEITRTNDLNAAIVCCDKNDNTNVFNDNGEKLHTSEFGILDTKISDNDYYAIATITSPTGTYLRSAADFMAKKIISSPIRNTPVYILKKESVNGFYKVEIIKRGTHYVGYMLEENLKILEYK